MPYDNAETFNDTLNQILQGEKSQTIEQFCQSFIATFNNDTEAAKIIGTGKLEMAGNKKEEAAQLAATSGFDIAGVFGLPTGTLGDLTKKAISAAFKGVRKRGYKKVANIAGHMTHVELISQALMFGLLVHYKDDLVDEDTHANPKKWGKETAKRMLKSLKSTSKKSLHLGEDDVLVKRLATMLEWCVGKDYIREEPEPNKMSSNFDEDDYSTLLTFASAELLGLPRDHFVQAQKTEENARVLSDKIDEIEQKFNDVQRLVKEALQQNKRPHDIINVLEQGAKIGGYLSVDINCIVDVVSNRVPENETQHKYYLKELKMALQHSQDMMDKKNEALSQRERTINVVPKDTTVEKKSHVKVSVDPYTAPMLGAYQDSSSHAKLPGAVHTDKKGSVQPAGYTQRDAGGMPGLGEL